MKLKSTIYKSVAWLFALCIAYPVLGQSGKVTFTKDIAPIIYNHCTVCHRPGEIGPFSLTNYSEVRERASIIKYVTAARFMPPWKADPDYNHLLGETILTQEEINLIGRWVDEGAELGRASDEPPLPQFPEGSLLGEPDLVLEFAQDYVHIGNNKDEYRYFVLPTGLTEDKIVKAIEFRPGNPKIVHHALMFEDTKGRARQIDERTPGYGFDAFDNGTGFNVAEVLNNTQYPGFAPGQKPRYYPDGLGQKISAGSDLVIQMHYAPWPVDESDRSRVNIFFAREDETVDRFIDDHIMLPFPGVLINGPFVILPNQVKTFHGVWTPYQDISLIGLFPHMHLLGQDWEVFIVDDQQNRINLISIPRWDFNWQGMYYFNRMMVVKKGWKIHAKATYDNTTENPFNPNNPPRTVSWGEGTEDEMYYLPFLYTQYKPGDENIIFGEEEKSKLNIRRNITKDALLPIHPNPVREGMVQVTIEIQNGQPISLFLFDQSGRMIRTLSKNEFFNAGRHIIPLNVNGLSPGMYIIHLISGQNNLSQRLIITE